VGKGAHFATVQSPGMPWYHETRPLPAFERQWELSWGRKRRTRAKAGKIERKAQLVPTLRELQRLEGCQGQ